jgi:hypothetical protein
MKILKKPQLGLENIYEKLPVNGHSFVFLAARISFTPALFVPLFFSPVFLHSRKMQRK